MEAIRPRLGDDVDRGAGMGAEARGDSAGFDTEFLQRVGKREWHVDIRHRVSSIAAIEKIGRAIALTARDGDARGIPERLAAGVAAIGIHGTT